MSYTSFEASGERSDVAAIADSIHRGVPVIAAVVVDGSSANRLDLLDAVRMARIVAGLDANP
ncbi:MAG TPA: hypothetical protein VGM37_03170 [Armatimonadota bacterium]|jgi:hypothetical protein